MHVEQCPNAKAWDKPIHKRSGRGGRPWRRLRENIFNRDGMQCQMCLRLGIDTFVDLHGPNAGVCDHIVALEFGGTDDEGNLQTICQDCNKRKTHAESQRGRGGSKPQG